MGNEALLSPVIGLHLNVVNPDKSVIERWIYPLCSTDADITAVGGRMSNSNNFG